MNMEEAAVRAINPRPAWGMCAYRLESLSRHDLLPEVQTGLLVVWFGSDPVDLPPAHRPPTETTADPGTVTGHQPSSAPREGTTYLTPVPPSVVKMPTFGRVVIVFMSPYFDRRVWVARIILAWPWYSYSVAGMPHFPGGVCVFHCVCSLYVSSEERIKQWLSKAKPFFNSLWSEHHLESIYTVSQLHFYSRHVNRRFCPTLIFCAHEQPRDQLVLSSRSVTSPRCVVTVKVLFSCLTVKLVSHKCHLRFGRRMV